MSWLEGVEKDTLVEIELDNGKKIVIYFIRVYNGIVEGKLKNGNIKRFKENKIEDLEILKENNKKEIINNLSINLTPRPD